MTRSIALCVLMLSACSDVDNLGEIDHPVFGEPRWEISLGGIEDDRATVVAMDPAGDVIAAGDFSGTVDFGNGTVTAAGSAAWISKRAAADGHAFWTVTLGTENASTAAVYDIATDSDGAVIVAAMYSGTIHLQDRVLSGPPIVTGGDNLLIKLDANGHLIWIREFRPMGAMFNNYLSVAVGHDGRIVVGGSYIGNFTFPNGSFPAPDIASFVAMFDPNGVPLWGVVGSHDQYIKSVAITLESDVLVTGSMPYRSTFGSIQMEPLAWATQFNARLTASGDVLWARVFGTQGSGRSPVGIAVDPTGQTFVVSTQLSPVTPPNVDAATIDSIDPNGQPIWTRQPASGVQANFATALPNAIVSGGTVHPVARAGSFEYRSDFGRGPRDGRDFLVAHDMDGRVLDHSAMEDGCISGVRDAATNGTGGLAMVGGIGGSAELGPCLRHAGKSDAVITLRETK